MLLIDTIWQMIDSIPIFIIHLSGEKCISYAILFALFIDFNSIGFNTIDEWR